MKTITLKMLYEQTVNYQPDLPVVIRIGEQVFSIDDIYFSTAEDMSDAKITIESWVKAENENEPGIII